MERRSEGSLILAALIRGIDALQGITGLVVFTIGVWLEFGPHWACIISGGAVWLAAFCALVIDRMRSQ